MYIYIYILPLVSTILEISTCTHLGGSCPNTNNGLMTWMIWGYHSPKNISRFSRKQLVCLPRLVYHPYEIHEITMKSSLDHLEITIPIGSMYGIYANIGGILMVNVTIYGIHWSYGIQSPWNHHDISDVSILGRWAGVAHERLAVGHLRQSILLWGHLAAEWGVSSSENGGYPHSWMAYNG